MADTETENVGLCSHVQFTRAIRSYPGSAADWEAYMSSGGLATTTILLAREHAADCNECATLLSALTGWSQ
jgi:hypothetical protein